MKKKWWRLIQMSAVVVGFFALYETAKTLLFPAMSVVTSHVITTILVGLITFFAARYVIGQEETLLKQRDLTNERLRDALAAAERSSLLLHSIVSSVDEGMVITDRELRILFINDAARALLGPDSLGAARLADVSRNPMIQQAFSEVLTREDRAEARIEVWRGNDKRVLRLHASPLRLGENQVDGVVGAFIDITKLEMLERIRQEFLTNVSHELRTPLTSITAYVETLLSEGLEDNENSLRFLATVQRNASRMRDLVNDISELSAIESGAVRLTVKLLRLRDIVDEVFTGLAPRCARNGVRLKNEVTPDFRVSADRRRLEQVLTNLVDNAIKFNVPGGEVLVSAVIAPDGGNDLIKVKDTGHGIPPEHLTRVFERFYRVDKARSRALGGTGLGLAIVKHLARAHGGEAHVESELGKGCEFVIKLPRRMAVLTASNEAESFPKSELSAK